MRAVVQRVTRASVRVEEQIVGEIENGLVVFLGVTHDDSRKDADYLAEKIVGLRIFADEDERMNVSLKEAQGAVLVVPQFTLYGDLRSGLRPSWSDAARPELAEPLYEYFLAQVRESISKVETGSFRKLMQVEFVNDGPVTILLDSRKLF